MTQYRIVARKAGTCRELGHSDDPAAAEKFRAVEALALEPRGWTVDVVPVTYAGLAERLGWAA